MRIFPVFLALLLFGCNAPPEPVACTMIGCSNGLSIRVNSTQTSNYSVTVSANNQVIGRFDCTAGQQCMNFIENQTPDSISVVIQSSGGTVTRSYRPEYQNNRPNGPNCPPECKQATVIVTVS